MMSSSSSDDEAPPPKTLEVQVSPADLAMWQRVSGLHPSINVDKTSIGFHHYTLVRASLAFAECCTSAHDGAEGYMGSGTMVPEISCVLLHDASSTPVWIVKGMQHEDDPSLTTQMRAPSNACELANGHVLVTRESDVMVEVNPTQRTVVREYTEVKSCLDVVELRDGRLVTASAAGIALWEREGDKLRQVRLLIATDQRARLARLPPVTEGAPELVAAQCYYGGKLRILDPIVPAPSDPDIRGVVDKDPCQVQALELREGVYVAYNAHVQPPKFCVTGNSGVYFMSMTAAGDRVDPDSKHQVEDLPKGFGTQSRGVCVLPNGNFAVSANNYAFAVVLEPYQGLVVGYLYLGTKQYVFGACSIMKGRLAVFCDNSGNQLALCRTNQVRASEEAWHDMSGKSQE